MSGIKVTSVVLLAWLVLARTCGWAQSSSPSPGAGAGAAHPGSAASKARSSSLKDMLPASADREQLWTWLQRVFLMTVAMILLLVAATFAWIRARTHARTLESNREAELATLERRYQDQIHKMNAPLKSKTARLSTFFMRLQNMIKADTKSEFFKSFSQAVLNGFNVDRAAFWIFDRSSNTLRPRIYSAVRQPQGGGANASELTSPALAKLSITPGEPNIIGWCALNRIGTSVEQIGRDASTAHLLGERNAFVSIDPVATQVVVPVTTIDSVTMQDRFVGVIAVGKISDGTSWSTAETQLLQAFGTMTGIAFARADLIELTAAELASTQEQSAREREQRKMIRSVLDRVVSHHVADQLLSRPDELNFEGELVEATVFFSDIKGFTRYSEERSPQEVVTILNEYLSAMTDVIQENGGTLDKFVGDEIVAFWGALPRTADHAVRTCRAAWRMREALVRLRDGWTARGLEPLEAGMGLSTGPMLFGCIGSSKKLDVTVMGDTVNLGSRIQSLTRKFPYDLIISESTFDQARMYLTADPLGEVEVKGKARKVRIYGVTDVKLDG